MILEINMCNEKLVMTRWWASGMSVGLHPSDWRGPTRDGLPFSSLPRVVMLQRVDRDEHSSALRPNHMYRQMPLARTFGKPHGHGFPSCILRLAATQLGAAILTTHCCPGPRSKKPMDEIASIGSPIGLHSVTPPALGLRPTANSC